MAHTVPLTLLLGFLLTAVMMVAEPSRGDRRDRAERAFREGNFKDAYNDYRALALDPADGPKETGPDLVEAIDCLGKLGRVDEVDDFREAVVALHKDQWRTLLAAAKTLADGEHYGYFVAGKFHRGMKRGGNAAGIVGHFERDRVRALQLFTQARALAQDDPDRAGIADLHFEFARVLFQDQSGRDDGSPWRLQILTNLNELPDDEPGRNGVWGTSRAIGAPVDADGRPVFYHVPKTFEAARNDGERWRWMLARTAELDPSRWAETQLIFADFLHSQFGVQTMAGFSGPVASRADDDSGPFAVSTLGDDETIARLATGVKRFKLPDEFNPIKIYETVAEGEKNKFAQEADETLAEVFEDRRQYPRAAEVWKRAIARYGPGEHGERQDRLDQIIGNWGEFGTEAVQPAGKPVNVSFRFRNGTKVHFEAQEILISKLLDDIKTFIKTYPNDNSPFDWHRVNPEDIGYRLVNENQLQYLGAPAGAWDVVLDPRPQHFDRRISVETPLKKAGAYLLTARMANGNTSRIIVWVADTAIVKKATPNDGTFYFVADAVTGKPVARANLEFFGYKWERTKPGQNRIVTTNFAENTDQDGQALLDSRNLKPEFTWLTIARTDAGRLAFLGFSNVWHPGPNDLMPSPTKLYVITDRPVYRPGQPVKFKCWVRQARYDGGDEEATAGKPFTLKINNPKGETVFEHKYQSDAFGGFDGEFTTPSDATLGVYSLHHEKLVGGGSFRLEEYKKPEFEVNIDAPDEPVKLGETIHASIRARYYFGAPVTEAKVAYKVTRTQHEHAWFPHGRWDWLYGAGYGWLSRAYAWYPGWSAWGWRDTHANEWGRFHFEPPEVVAEDEVAIGADGTVKIAIDTAPALRDHGDSDHRYEITAEVVDASRRTITGNGSVLAARKPFAVFVWLDRGYYQTGQDIEAHVQARTLDGKPIAGKGKATLFQVSYENDKPVEKLVETWDIDTNDEGQARLKLKAGAVGQYRLSCVVTDARGRSAEGGYVFVVRDQAFDGLGFRFNDLELIPDKREYAPGERVKLLVNTNHAGGTVVLFARAADGAALPTQVLRLDGKSAVYEIFVVKHDMPNFFVEALTVHDGKVHDETVEIIVPPQNKTLNVEVQPSRTSYKPGAPAKVRVKLTDEAGQPFVGSTVLTLYDKALDAIAGGSNVPEIRAFFWSWRRHHQARRELNLDLSSANLVANGDDAMEGIGVFGGEADFGMTRTGGMMMGDMGGGMGGMNAGFVRANRLAAPAPAGAVAFAAAPAAPAPGEVQPVVRRAFADAAFWAPRLTTDGNGLAEVSLTMPENLTAWKVRAWALGEGTQVGQGEAEVVTAKDLLIRMQTPRFAVQTDEVVLSANIHNYLKIAKDVRAVLELEGKVLELLEDASRTVHVPSGGEQRVDWRVRVTAEGEAVVRMKALTDEESDAAELRFPTLVHGMLKTESFAGSLRPEAASARLTYRVPEARRPADSRLEIRYSPTLAGALVDALPYLADYPYGCTEQTLNRFLPTVIAQGTLRRLGLDLKALQAQRTNLNAQEIGDPAQRQRFPRNPVFDEDEVRRMVREGLKDLTAMQLADGGWGWFSGFGERSDAHITAQVVHGLQTARKQDIALVPGMYERGTEWLKRYQSDQVLQLRNAPSKTKPYKERADNLDAFVFMVLADADVLNREMFEYLERDRPHLAVYGLTLYGLALEKLGNREALGRVLQNIEQYLVKDAENQTAYLRLTADCPWWFWYGSETETQANYLKLLARTDPKGATAPALVKYLLNNRRHATYWNSTRDTALCVEALADYLKNSGEDQPDMTVTIVLDGKERKRVKISANNLFRFDNALVLTGPEIESGAHTVEVRREGRGPVYFNAYLTYFTQEDPIRRAGLEVKVNRKLYRVVAESRAEEVAGSRGQVVGQKGTRERREPLQDLSTLKSGDLVEVELEIVSKNDYEYLVFEDHKAAGFEPVEVRSGYNGNDLGAYMELRDQKVCFFARALARGTHSVRYRLRAEVPGKFSALPAVGLGMYAPELRANSDEGKVVIED